VNLSRMFLQGGRRMKSLPAQGALHGSGVNRFVLGLGDGGVRFLPVFLEGVLGAERAAAVAADRLDLVVLYVRHWL